IFPEPEEVICSGQHPGDATTASRHIEDASTTTAGLISSAANSAFRSAFNSLLGSVERQDLDTGLAAGDHSLDLSAWAAFSHVDTDNTHKPTRFNSKSNTVLVGVDTSINENLIIGLALGVEETSIDTVFNLGEQELNGYTVAPYIGYLLTPNFSIDASFGYTTVDIDQFRISVAPIAVPGVNTGDTESDRVFVSGNLNYFNTFDRWFFAGRLGVIYAEEDIDAVVEVGPDAFTSAARTVEFGQVQVAAELAYTGLEFEPYLLAVYENDFEHEDVLLNSAQVAPANDDDSFRLGLGMRYFWSDQASINFTFDWQIDRDDYESKALSVNGRWAF
ncbi:MAG: autotransporter outer membrane beta-barrel domain-containing protein, partial [Gammaproteobacteria bacterium]|nr:autotransporter outer membrane beta-barrel domain-containing protein [Gammaproteobacteria bacterium]